MAWNVLFAGGVEARGGLARMGRLGKLRRGMLRPYKNLACGSWRFWFGDEEARDVALFQAANFVA